jgi:hypothetical protein
MAMSIISVLVAICGMFIGGCTSGQSGGPPAEPQTKRTVTFAGHEWAVKYGDQLGPGPNYFSDSEDSLWVDEKGHLHMTIMKREGKWFCTEVINSQSLGYGSYIFTLQSRVDQLDENIILGMFTWDTDAPEHHYREIDFEFGKWQKAENKNAQFVIQPWTNEGNTHRYDILYDGPTETTTHIMKWQPDRIHFQSYYGRYSEHPPKDKMIHSWTYTGQDNPPPGGENIRINLWLVWGEIPTDGKDLEIIIEDFKFIPNATDSRPLNQEEKDRLGAAWDKNNTRLSSSIDITYSKKTIHSARLSEARRKSNQQKTQVIRQSLNKPEIEVKSFGVKTSENEEEFYSHLRIQIKDPSRYREDVIIYVDEKKEESHYDAVHINNNEANFKIDKKRKLVTYDEKSRWGAGQDTLAYGTFFAHKEIGLDIFGLRFSRTKTREFRHKGLVEVSGNDAVSIELVDLKNEKPVYEIFLDVNDWSKLYKCILYNKGGTAVTKTSEFSKFTKHGEGKVYYPHLIIQKKFDAEGNEMSRDVIYVEEVGLGLSIPDDVFELNVSDEYQIINSSISSSAAKSP